MNMIEDGAHQKLAFTNSNRILGQQNLEYLCKYM